MSDMVFNATLIGDVIGSRQVPDRSSLHEHILRAMLAANARHQPVEPLAVTVGDEFQGRFGTMGGAIDAALRIRLRMLDLADVRCGIGWGPVTILDAERRIQDGPGWWDARDALDIGKHAESQAATENLRTVVVSARRPDVAALNAALMFRDQLIGKLDDRSRRILIGLLDGMTRSDIADLERISVSAVSQRARRHGLDLIVLGEELLAEML